MASYKIAQGDTLSAIAAKNKTDVATLQKLNPTIKDPNVIYAGSSLNLPESAVAVAPIPPIAPGIGIGTGSPTPAVSSSDAIRAAEDKSKIDQAKADADAKAEVDRLRTQKEIADLRGSILPNGTPTAPTSNLQGDYRTLLGEKDTLGNSLEDYQGKILENRKQRDEITNSLNEFKRTSAQGQSESAFLSQMSEKERLANESIDRLDREATTINQQITNRSNTINTLMALKKEDYATTKEAYDTAFSQNLSLMNALNVKKNQQATLDEKAADNARANLQIIQNEIQKGTLKYGSLDPETKATIDALEVQAGVPKGFTSFITSNVKGDIVSTNSRTDSAGNTYFDVLTKNPDGSLKVSTVYAGKSKTTGTDSGSILSKDDVKKLSAIGVSEALGTKIATALLGGASADDVRAALKKDGVDPRVVDRFDNVVGISSFVKGGTY